MSSSFVNKRIDKNLLNRDSEAESATEKNKSEKKKVVSTYIARKITIGWRRFVNAKAFPWRHSRGC